MSDLKRVTMYQAVSAEAPLVSSEYSVSYPHGTYRCNIVKKVTPTRTFQNFRYKVPKEAYVLQGTSDKLVQGTGTLTGPKGMWHSAAAWEGQIFAAQRIAEELGIDLTNPKQNILGPQAGKTLTGIMSSFIANGSSFPQVFGIKLEGKFLLSPVLLATLVGIATIGMSVHKGRGAVWVRHEPDKESTSILTHWLGPTLTLDGEGSGGLVVSPSALLIPMLRAAVCAPVRATRFAATSMLLSGMPENFSNFFVNARNLLVENDGILDMAMLTGPYGHLLAERGLTIPTFEGLHDE